MILLIQAVPSVELGPAAKDVCRLGFEAEEVEGDDKEDAVGDVVQGTLLIKIAMKQFLSFEYFD